MSLVFFFIDLSSLSICYFQFISRLLQYLLINASGDSENKPNIQQLAFI